MPYPGFIRHEDDKGIDEILFIDRPITKIQEAHDAAFLRLAIIERYKTSGLSGDEWRFSSGLWVREGARKDWRLISTGGDLKFHCSQLYPELYGDLETGKWTADFFARKVAGITFQWKGYPVYLSHYDNKAIDLLVAAGHLALAWEQATENGMPYEPLKRHCAQPGCSALHTTIYALKSRYCRQGHETKVDPPGSDIIGFCHKHVRRGDCGLQDADVNYEVVSGPGPDGHEPDPKVVKPAIFGGATFLNPEPD